MYKENQQMHWCTCTGLYNGHIISFKIFFITCKLNVTADRCTIYKVSKPIYRCTSMCIYKVGNTDSLKCVI